MGKKWNLWQTVWVKSDMFSSMGKRVICQKGKLSLSQCSNKLMYSLCPEDTQNQPLGIYF